MDLKTRCLRTQESALGTNHNVYINSHVTADKLPHQGDPYPLLKKQNGRRHIAEQAQYSQEFRCLRASYYSSCLAVRFPACAAPNRNYWGE